MQPREEEATYSYHHDANSSQEKQRRLRRVREDQPISKSKVFPKPYTTKPVAKGKAEDSTLKACDMKCFKYQRGGRVKGRVNHSSSHVESRGRVQGRVNHSSSQVESTGRVNNSSFQIESRDRVQGKTEATTSRIREVKCFKCQGQGHYANECTNKKIGSKATTPPIAFVEKEFGFVQEDSLELEEADQNVQEEEVIEKSDHEDVLAIQEDLHTILVAEKDESMDNLDSFEKCDESFSQSRRYSLSPTRDPYILDFELLEEVDGDKMLLSVQYECEIQEVEHVDFVFGDAAFCKPESKARIFDFMIQGNGEQTQCFDIIVKEGSFLDFSRKKKHYGSFELVMENGVAGTLSFDHCLFPKGHMPQGLRMNQIHSAEIGIGVQRHGPIVDKVKDARKVLELATLFDFEVPTTPQERSLSLSLESACRDDTDLRTNLFQEEGYDMIMGSIKDEQDGTLLKPLEETQEHELDNFKEALKRIIQVILVKEDNQRTIGSFYDEIIKLPKKTHLHCSAQMKSEINWFNSMTTWIIFSTHQRLMSKWNQFNPSLDEGDIEFTSQMTFSLLDLDQRTFNGGFRANQKELSYEPNFPGILVHPSITSNWISIKIGSDLEDMNFTNRRICFMLNHASRPKIAFHSPTQELFRYETTWIMLMALLALQQAQDRKESPLDHKDTLIFPRWVNMVLNLKSSRPDWFVSFQTYVWHPGGISSKPNKPISWELKRRSSRITSRCMHKEFKG